MALKFGRRSRERLATVDILLQQVFEESLSLDLIDMSVVQGRRSKADQDAYFATEKSKVRWPNSKHNVRHPYALARAVDVAPYVNGAISWKKEHCIYMAGIVLATAKALGIGIRWGGNWDMDHEPITDQDFQDLVHFELI